MKVDRAALKAALMNLGLAVENKNIIPILSNVKIFASGGELVVMSCNLFQYVSVSLDCEGDLEPTTLNFKKLKAVVDNAGKGVVDITVGASGKALIKCGKSRLTFPTLPAEDFPAWPDQTSNSVSMDIEAQSLLRSISSVEYAIAKGNVNEVFNGAWVILDKDQSYIVATDRHRMAASKLDYRAEGREVAIVPLSAIKSLMRILKDHEGAINVVIGGGALLVESGATLFRTNLISGGIPSKWMDVIPKRQDFMLINKADLKAGLAVASVSIAGEKSGFRRVKLSFIPGEISVSSVGQDSSEGVYQLEADHEKTIDIHADYDYISDLTNGAIPGDEIKLSIGDTDTSAMLFVTENERHVLQPHRV